MHSFTRFPRLGPELQLAAVPDLSEFAEDLNKTLLTAVGDIAAPTLSTLWQNDALTNQFQQLDDSLRAITRQIAQTFDTDRIVEGAYPRNWRGHQIKYDTIEQMVFEEGISLSHALRPSLARRLGRAKDETARRGVLSAEWRPIAADCREALDRLTTTSVRPRVTFVRQAIDAIEAGHTSAAQALLANVIDTCIGRDLDPEDNWKVKGRPSRKGRPARGRPKDLSEFHEAIGDDAMWIAFTLGPIWRAYERFDAATDSRVPSRFNRHATVHAVSRRQFSRTNAVQALLAATELVEALALVG